MLLPAGERLPFNPGVPVCLQPLSHKSLSPTRHILWGVESGADVNSCLPACQIWRHPYGKSAPSLPLCVALKNNASGGGCLDCNTGNMGGLGAGSDTGQVTRPCIPPSSPPTNKIMGFMTSHDQLMDERTTQDLEQDNMSQSPWKQQRRLSQLWYKASLQPTQCLPNTHFLSQSWLGINHVDDPVICPVPPKAFTHYMPVAPPIAGQRDGGQRTSVQSRWARHFPKQVSFIHTVFCSKNLGNDSRHLLLPINHEVLCQLPLQPSSPPALIHCLVPTPSTHTPAWTPQWAPDLATQTCSPQGHRRAAERPHSPHRLLNSSHLCCDNHSLGAQASAVPQESPGHHSATIFLVLAVSGDRLLGSHLVLTTYQPCGAGQVI